MAQFNSKNKASRTARRWFTDFDINMKLHPDNNDVVLKYDLQAVSRALKNLLQTNHYERPFKPSLGVDIRGMLFELDTTSSIVLEEDIKSLINKYEPRATVTDVVASTRGNELNVSMYFTVHNDPQPHELDLTLERIR